MTHEKNILAAFHSVNLINQLDLILEPLSEEEKKTRQRNVEHLKIMILSESFEKELTIKQKTEINKLII